MSGYFIIGAGFSAAAGLPVANMLFDMVVSEAKRDTLYRNVLKPDMQRYLLYLERVSGQTTLETDINFEDFMSFLDTESYLGLDGDDRWTTEGSRAQLAIRHLVARILWQRQRAMKPEHRELIDHFASRLEVGDIVLTFNYDTLLEEALARVKKHVCLAPHWLRRDRGRTNPGVTLLKLHGSIDWFHRRRYVEDRRFLRQHNAGNPRNAVFNNPRIRRQRIVPASKEQASGLAEIRRVKNLREFFESAVAITDAPFLLSPSYSKIVHISPLADLWYGLSFGGSFSTRMAIIGYSMPRYDEYVRQALYQLVRNYQHFDAGLPKANLKMIDRRLSDHARDEYVGSYQFVDWTRTDTHFDGFSSKAVDMIFAAA